jgi:outer membrane protein assembly factor BamB
MKTLRLLSLAGALAVLPALAAVRGDDWPVYRGDALMTGVSKAKLPDKLVVLWAVETRDAIEGAPVVADGVVYVGSYDEHLYAADLATGKEKWRYKADPKMSAPFKASPAVRGKHVYIGDIDGDFHCVEAATGKRVWKFQTGAEIASGANFAGDLILFGSHDETLYALTPDGQVKWKVKTEGPVNGSPVVSDGKTFVAGCDGSVHVIDVARGVELAKIELSGQAAATAAASGDRLFVGTMTNEVQAVDWKKQSVDWTFRPEKRAQPFYAAAALTDKLVIAGSRDKKVYALERDSGKEKWHFETDGRVDGAPVVVGDRVFVGSLDGNLYVLDLASGAEKARFKLDGPVTGSPAVVDGYLLIGTQKGTLYCFGAKK